TALRGPEPALDRTGRGGGRSLPARLLAAPAAGSSGRVLRLEHALLRHAHLPANAPAFFLLQQPLRPGGAAAISAGRRRTGERGAAATGRPVSTLSRSGRGRPVDGASPPGELG